MMLKDCLILRIIIKKDNRSLPIGKNKKVIGMFKDEIGGKIMTEFCALRAKSFAFKLDDNTK